MSREYPEEERASATESSTSTVPVDPNPGSCSPSATSDGSACVSEKTSQETQNNSVSLEKRSGNVATSEEPRWTEPAPVSALSVEKRTEEGSSAASPESESCRAKEASSGVAARGFAFFAGIGPLVLLVLWALQSLPVLMGRELRGLYELASGVRMELLAGIQGVAHTDGQAELPAFGWFLEGLSQLGGLLPGLDAVARFVPGNILADPLSATVSVAASLATLALVLLTWTLARATGNDKKTALAAGLVLLTGLTFLGLPAVAADALLFAAILALSSLCLYRGWIKAFAPVWLICGFAAVALAMLVGGLAGIFPLFASLLFLVWRGTFRRAGARDGAFAFGLMLVLLCVWAANVAFSDGGRDQLAALLEFAVVAPVLDVWASQGRELALAIPVLAVIWLPWILVLPFLPWERLGTFLGNCLRNRTQRPGQGWIWWWLLVGVVVLGLLSAGEPLYLLAVLPALSLLTAQGILSLSCGRSERFYAVLAFLLLLLGVFFGVAGVYPLVFDRVPLLFTALHPAGLPLVALLVEIAVFLVFGLLLWKAVNRASAGGSLLAVTVLAVVLTVPFSWYASSAPTSEVQTQEQAPAEDPVATPVVPVNEAPVSESAQPTTEAVPAPAVPEATPAPEATPVTPETAPTAPEAAPAATPAASEAVPVVPATSAPVVAEPAPAAPETAPAVSPPAASEAVPAQ